jgi:putative FmdB family regulatory protein
MPIFDLECTVCNTRKEVIQSCFDKSAPLQSECKVCGSKTDHKVLPSVFAGKVPGTINPLGGMDASTGTSRIMNSAIGHR